MTEHTPRLLALPLDTLDRTAARYRVQPNDYQAATELTMPRALWEDLGSPSLLFATLSAEVPQLPVDIGPGDPVDDDELDDER